VDIIVFIFVFSVVEASTCVKLYVVSIAIFNKCVFCLTIQASDEKCQTIHIQRSYRLLVKHDNKHAIL